MSLLFARGRAQRTFGGDAATLLAQRTRGRAGRALATPSMAMTHSAVWACLRLRADLISTSPVDCYRQVDGRALKVPTPLVLQTPGGSGVDVTEWLYGTQMDLDRFGNAFALIKGRDALGLPTVLEALPAEEVSVLTRNRRVRAYRVGGDEIDPFDVWHERQYTPAGSPVGLSPLAAAALTISQYLSAQEFARDWFAAGSVPNARLKNTSKTLTPNEALEVKERFRASVSNGDLFVHGADWDYEMIAAKANESEFLAAMRYGVGDVCRFLGVPGDMVDAEGSSGSITYANVTQRNLQLLILNLGPAVVRRERALSNLLPRPRFVKLNTDAVVLRMDPQSRADMNRVLVESRQRTVSEVREKDDLPPYTPEQVAEIVALSPKKETANAPA